MLTQLHDHMVGEVQQSARTDTVFFITGVIFNLVVLGVNWAVAQPHNGGHSATNDAILAVLIVVTLGVNALSLRALSSGKDRMQRLLSGLAAIYADAGVEKYYDPALRASYRSRYTAFMGVLSLLAAAALVVPLIQRLISS